MSDIRDRVQVIDRTDRHSVAGKAISYRPEFDDAEELAGLLVRSAISASGVEVNDVENVDALAERAHAYARDIIFGEAKQGVLVIDGVTIRGTSKELIISIPSAEEDLDAEAILSGAENALYHGADYPEPDEI